MVFALAELPMKRCGAFNAFQKTHCRSRSMAAEQDNISSGEETGERRAPRYRYSSERGVETSARGGAGAVVEATVAVGEGSHALGVTTSMHGSGLDVPTLDWSRTWMALAAAGVCILALFPSEFSNLFATWYTDAGWSHGFVVPLISLFLIRIKWESLKKLTPRGTWVGFAILLVGVIGQILYRVTGTASMSTLSILVVLMGIVLFVLGWEYMKILWLPIGYLVFAIPPPKAMYAALTIPMQQIAAEVGVWFMPLLGCEAHRMSTLIEVMRPGQAPTVLDVEQACRGCECWWPSWRWRWRWRTRRHVRCGRRFSWHFRRCRWRFSATRCV